MGNVAPERIVNGIKTRNLHGKDYVEVATRVQILHQLKRAEEIKDFEMVESQPYELCGRAYWRVSARIDGKMYIGSAEIHLNADPRSADGQDCFACAETSAFGRMLAFAGLGTVESIASYDEIMRAQPGKVISERNDVRVIEAAPAKQLPPAQATPEQRGTLEAIYQRGKERGLWEARADMFPFIHATLGVAVNRQTIYDLSQEQLEQLLVAVEEAEVSAAQAS